MEYIRFNSGKVVSEDSIKTASDAALKAINNELPEEVHCYEAYKIVLERCKIELRERKIIL